MRNINQRFINMLIFLSTFISILLGCANLSAEKKDNFSSLTEKTIQQIQVDKYPIELKLDTTSHYQNKRIEPDDSLFFGDKIYLIHVGEGDDFGYLIFKDQNTFCIALIAGVNGYKVIGITEISGLGQGEEYIELLYSDLPITSITFGIIKKTDSNIKTIKAWKINNSKKIIEEINPSTVDFTETYNTDTD